MLAMLAVNSVLGDDIANIVSKWTGIPVTKLVESEMQKLLKMEDVLHSRLIGQDEAVEVVSDASPYYCECS